MFMTKGKVMSGNREKLYFKFSTKLKTERKILSENREELSSQVQYKTANHQP